MVVHNIIFKGFRESSVLVVDPLKRSLMLLQVIFDLLLKSLLARLIILYHRLLQLFPQLLDFADEWVLVAVTDILKSVSQSVLVLPHAAHGSLDGGVVTLRKVIVYLPVIDVYLHVDVTILSCSVRQNPVNFRLGSYKGFVVVAERLHGYFVSGSREYIRIAGATHRSMSSCRNRFLAGLGLTAETAEKVMNEVVLNRFRSKLTHELEKGIFVD